MLTRNPRIAYIALVLLSVMSVSAAAETAVTPQPNALMAPAPPPAVFAYPGTKCPASSTAIEGPEQQMAAEDGAIYCRFKKVARAMDRAQVGDKCPPGMIEYKNPKYKPPAAKIWCTNPEMPDGKSSK